jgi:hypothetical protein
VTIQTTLGLWNTGPTDAGPLTIEYFDQNGTVIQTGTIPSLPPAQSARIHPGVFGYPASPSGFGWARVSACNASARLVGWSIAELVSPASTPSDPGNREAYGEVLAGNNDKEPGTGFAVTSGGATWTRKAAPLVRVDPTWYWPGYTTFANDSVPNVGPYRFRFYNSAGSGTCNASGIFAGLRFPNSSTTYEDALLVNSPACVGNFSERVDVTNGPFVGMNVLGDPFGEYGIPGFAGVPADPE